MCELACQEEKEAGKPAVNRQMSNEALGNSRGSRKGKHKTRMQAIKKRAAAGPAGQLAHGWAAGSGKPVAHPRPAVSLRGAT